MIESVGRAGIVVVLSFCSLRLKSDVPNSRFLSPICRTPLIFILIALYSTNHMRGFMMLMSIQAIYSVLRSVVEGVFAYIGPNDLLCGRLPSEAIFGWYYAWHEPPWKRFMPRDRRGVKGAAISSIFWLSVLFGKFCGAQTSQSHRALRRLLLAFEPHVLEEGLRIFTFATHVLGPLAAVDYSGIASMMPSVYHILTLIELMDPESFAALVHCWVVWLALIFRVAFAVVFFVANLQIFFAGGMAVAGGLSSARSKGEVGST